MSFVALAIGAGAAGAGLIKSFAIDAPKASRDRKLAAETQRNSPWTGLKADPITEADPVGSALQFGATGAQMGAGFQNAAAQKGLLEAQTKWLNAGGTPMATAAVSGSNPWSLGANTKLPTFKF